MVITTASKIANAGALQASVATLQYLLNYHSHYIEVIVIYIRKRSTISLKPNTKTIIPILKPKYSVDTPGNCWSAPNNTAQI